MRVFEKAAEGVEELVRYANRLAPFRITGLVAMGLVWFVLNSAAATYYVSSSSGSDGNSGTSASAAWQTIGHVNGQTFLPGDAILFKRGDVWNESLTPPSSGVAGNPITFDAYGTGAAPNLTGYYAVPTSAWIAVTSNVWKAAVPSTFTTVNFCLFGSVWGQKVAAVSSNLSAPGNFYLANGFFYIYSSGNPATFYGEAIVPMALSNVPVININGQSWLTLQHFLMNWFDQYGVYVQGASDHLVFANMEADAMIPQGTQPLGFYVSESAPGPGDIKIYNSEAHMNYDGFRFDGAATAIAMVNDKGYANRDGALVDNTGAVNYSYCHFYASSLAVAGSTDVEWTSGSGPIAGAGNVGTDTAPAVQAYQRYPAEVTLTVDDAGMTAGADNYYAGTVLPIADAARAPVGAAITVGYPLAQTLIGEFQGWINAGRDVTSHSISHTYYTNTDAMEIQYTGSGAAAALSISGNVLTITVTGADDSVSYNLAQGQAQGTIGGLNTALVKTGKFTTSYLTPCQGPYGTGCSAYTFAALLSQDLADVSGQDVKGSVYHMQLDVTRLTTDEITMSRRWMTENLTGLPTTPVYVYPGGYETAAMQGITEGVPYAGARGALKEDLGVNDTYADGFNAQNITSFGVNPSWMGLAPASLNQKVQALVWKESVWGVPWGIFWHFNAATGAGELSAAEVTNLIADLQQSGATIQTNTGLVNWLLGGKQEAGADGSDYYTIPASSMNLNFGPTKNSPVVDAGENLGTAYELDLNGVNQNSYGSGWEIGAHVYEGFAAYGGGQPGSYFAVGEGGSSETLTVRVMGGGGSVSDSQGGIVDCTATGGICSASYAPGTADTLTASPGRGGLFSGWSNCIGLATCALTMLSSQTEQAVFTAMNPSPLETVVQPNEWWCDITAPGICTPNKHWQYELQLPGAWIGTAPTTPNGCSINGGAGLPYWITGASPAAMGAGLQQAVTDMECFRAAGIGVNTSACTMIDAPPGFYELTGGIVWPQSTATQASCFDGLRSTLDSNLPMGQVIGSHGIMDNLSSTNDVTANGVVVTQVRIENPDLTGQNMYFALGATNGYGPGLCSTSGVICGITALSVNTIMLASTGVVNTTGTTVTETGGASFQTGWSTPFPITINGTGYTVSAVNSPTSITLSSSAGNQTGVLYSVAAVPSVGTFLVNLANGYVSPMLGGSGTSTVTIDTGGSQESVTPEAAINQSGIYATWSETHAAGTIVCYNTSCGGGAGVVNTSGTAVTLVAGQRFNSDMTSITINGATYAVASWTAPGAALTLRSSAGIQTGVLYSAASLVTNGTGAFTLANGEATNTGAYNDLQSMVQVVCSSNGCAAMSACSPLATGSGQCANSALAGAAQPDHFVVEDVAAERSYGNLGAASYFSFGQHGTETSITQLCSHAHFRHDAALGDWSSPLVGSHAATNGFQLGCIYDSLLDSAATQFLQPSTETHAVGTGFGSQHNVSHNYFSGGSSCAFAGGQGNTLSITSPNYYVINTDGEYRRNVCSYPYAFLGYGEVPGYNHGGNYYWPNNFTLYRKNCFEQKSGLRLVLDGNICENSDTSGGQFGASMSMGTRNVSTGFFTGGQNYNTQMSDVVMSNTVFRNVCYGPDSNRSATNSGGGGVAFPPRRMDYSNNLLYGLGTNVPGCSGGHQSGVEFDQASQTWQGTISSGNPAVFTADCEQDIGVYGLGTGGATCIGQVASIAFTGGSACTAGSLAFSSPGGFGGIMGSGSFTCSGASIGTVSVTNSGALYVSPPTVSVSSGTCTGCSFTAVMVATPVAPVAPVEVLDMSAGDPVGLYGCEVSGYNVPYATYAGGSQWLGSLGPRVVTGSTPWTGTPAAGNLQVSFPVSVTSGDSSGYCTLTNVQGGSQNVQWRHATTISSRSYGISSASNATNGVDGPQHMMNFAYQDNITLFGTSCIGGLHVTAGTTAEEFWSDFESANWAYDVCPGDAASSYTEFDNNRAIPVSGCSNSVGCNPPNTIYFPATANCAGSTATNCVGFVGAMNTSSMPLTLADYHGYALLCSGGSTSAYCARGANPASDGAAMGANISNIDAAESANQYCYPNGGPCLYPEYPTAP